MLQHITTSFTLQELGWAWSPHVATGWRNNFLAFSYIKQVLYLFVQKLVPLLVNPYLLLNKSLCREIPTVTKIINSISLSGICFSVYLAENGVEWEMRNHQIITKKHKFIPEMLCCPIE